MGTSNNSTTGLIALAYEYINLLSLNLAREDTDYGHWHISYGHRLCTQTTVTST